jgi:hypothetical protein
MIDRAHKPRMVPDVSVDPRTLSTKCGRSRRASHPAAFLLPRLRLAGTSDGTSASISVSPSRPAGSAAGRLTIRAGGTEAARWLRKHVLTAYETMQTSEINPDLKAG